MKLTPYELALTWSETDLAAGLLEKATKKQNYSASREAVVKVLAGLDKIAAHFAAETIASIYIDKKCDCCGERHTKEDGLVYFTNKYKCPCGEEWEDEWCAACNDRCPKCNKEIEPYESDDEVIVEPDESIHLIRTCTEEKWGDSVLDELVHEAAQAGNLPKLNEQETEAGQEESIASVEEVASGINNQGHEAQIKFLLQSGFTTPQIIAAGRTKE